VSSARPLVSILTPSLNQDQFLGDCIDSVARQTYEPLEHIVVDGGSSDSTLALLEGAPEHVRWISEPDRGQAHAVNKAFSLCEGEIVGWVNSDDAYADRRAVAWAVEAFERQPGADVVMGHALLVNERNVVLQLIWSPRPRRRLLELVHYVYQPTLFIRRRALAGEEPLLREDLDFVFDRDLVLRLLERSPFHHVGRVVAVDRHQRHRKVERAAFHAEAERFDASLGIPKTRIRAAAARWTKACMRLAGAISSRRLTSDVEPAIPLVWPPGRERLRWQLVTRRSRMPF
jgi:glycosyltransferase involved in cell wall biosynthesis